MPQNATILPDSTPNFSGGMDSWDPPQDLQPNQYFSAMNLDLETSAVLQTRPGTRKNGNSPETAAISNIWFYDTAAAQQLFSAVNNKLYFWNNATWTQVSTFAISTTNRVAFKQAIDNLFISDGVNSVKRWNGTTETDEGTAATSCPKALLLEWISGYLLASGVAGFPDYIFYPGTPLTFNTYDAPNGNFIRIGEGSGGKIKAMKMWDNNNLVVCKTNETWLVDVDPTVDLLTSSWQRSRLHPTVGCVASETMVQVGHDMWWLSNAGVISLQRLYQESQTDVSPSVSEPMRAILDQLNHSAVGLSSAFYWRNRYFLSVPIASSATPNFVLVYNTITACWVGFWSNLNATCFAIQNFADDSRLVYGDVHGNVKALMDRPTDGIFDDDGTAIATSLVSRGFTWQTLVNQKLPVTVDVRFYNSQTICSLDMLLNQLSTEHIADGIVTGVPGPALPVALPFNLGGQGTQQLEFPTGAVGMQFMAQYILTTQMGFVAYRSIVGGAIMQTPQVQKKQ